MPGYLTISEVIAAARRKLDDDVWDYSIAGAETETTLRRNRAAIGRMALLPRVLRDVSHCDTSTGFLGQRLALPVMVAPIGTVQLFDPDGARSVARATGRAETIGFVSTMARPHLEEVIAAATGPMIFQVYVKGGRDWLQSFIRRVEDAGYSGLCFTVDCAAYARTERLLIKRYKPKGSGMAPNLEGMVPDDAAQARLSWRDIEWIRRQTQLPLMLKGILSPDDARLAVECGVDAVGVSNHGGRRLDHAPGTLDVLADVVAAVAGRAEVAVDGGFLRGTDVIKAIALGARAVLVGKLACWALAADGEDGLVDTLALLRHEMETAMANLGVTHLGELGPQCLALDATPVPAADPGDRYVTGTA